MRGTLASLTLLGLAACGGSEPDAPAAPAVAAAQPFAPDPDVDPARSDTVVVLVVDGLCPADLAPEPWLAERMTAIPSLVAGGTLWPRAVAASTGGNAALATLLTGLPPSEHGVFSVHEPGRGRLDDRVGTLAESFQELDWMTVASVAHAREARGIGGFAQGFTAYDFPGGGRLVRPAAEVAAGLVEGARGRLVSGGSLMLLGTFADAPAEPPFTDEETPRTAIAVEAVRRRLGPAAKDSPDLAELLAQLDGDPVTALRLLQSRFARSRGAGEGRLWRQALRDTWLLQLDRAVGDVLGMLEESGRATAARVFLIGLRADDSLVDAMEGGPRLTAERLIVPLVHRAPGSIGGGEVRAGGVFPLVSFRSLVESSALGAEERDRGAVALSVSPDGAVHAAFAAGDDGRLLHLERYADGQTVLHEASGPLLDVSAAAPPVPAMARALEVEARTPTLALRGGRTERPLSLTWRLSDGGAVRADADRYRPAARGEVTIPGDGGGADLALRERGASVLVTISASASALPRIRMGATPLTELPALFVQSESAITPEGGVEVPLTFTRDVGLGWTLRVTGEGPVEALVSVWPPRDPDKGLDYLEGPDMTVAAVGARQDLLHIRCTAPLELVLKKRGVESFAVACRLNDRFLGPDEMECDSALFVGEDGFDVLVPSWQPSPSAALADVAAAVYAPGALPGPGELVIGRTGFGPVPGLGSGRDPFQLEILKRLPASE